MTVEEKVLQSLRDLTPEKQRQVLEFIDSLRIADQVSKPLRSLEGFLAEFNVDITEEDIAQARREMWGNFPRDIS